MGCVPHGPVAKAAASENGAIAQVLAIPRVQVMAQVMPRLCRAGQCLIEPLQQGLRGPRDIVCSHQAFTDKESAHAAIGQTLAIGMG